MKTYPTEVQALYTGISLFDCLILFYKTDHPTVELTLNGKLVKSKKTINVLGVVFDSKMLWSNQISQAINKSKKALHGIKLIKKYLTKNETNCC